MAIKKSFIQSKFPLIQRAAQNSIDKNIEMLEATINCDDLKENKLTKACKSKAQAVLTINSISNKAELTGKRKQEIIRALEYAFETLMGVANYDFKIKEEEFVDEEDNIQTIEGLPPDLQNSVSEAMDIAFKIAFSIGDTIDQLNEDEETKQHKIDNLKPTSIIERYKNITN